MEKTKIKHVYIIGSKGIPAKYGGFESFVENLTKRQTDKTIQYHIACMAENSLKSDIKEKEFIYNGAKCFNVDVPWTRVVKSKMELPSKKILETFRKAYG